MGSVSSTPLDCNNIITDDLFNLPQILPTVISSLHLEDLKSCRLVNKFWEKITNEIIRSRIQVFLRPHIEMVGFVKHQKLFCESRTIPFESFEINMEYGETDVSQDSKILKDFFETCGNSMKQLKLTGIQDKVNFGIDLGQILTYCPHLQSLEFKPIVDITSTERNGSEFNSTLFHSQSELKLFLNGVPNIQKFVFSNIYKFSDKFIDGSISEILTEIVANDNLRFLNTLELYNFLPLLNTDNDMKLLINMKLPLKKFTAVSASLVEFPYLHDLLEGMKDTLKFLNLNLILNDNKNQWKFKFSRLTQLRIHSSLICNGLHGKVPNLQSLLLIDTSCTNTKNCLRPDCMLFRQQDPKLSPLLIRHFSNLNLRRVELVGDDEILLRLYDTFPGIEELIIYTSARLTTKGFTGLTEEEVNERYFWPITSSREDVMWEAGCIGRLTKLQNLQIKTPHYKPSVDHLSESVIKFGICGCKTITTLCLDVYLEQVSVEGISQLDYLQTLYVTPTTLGLFSSDHLDLRSSQASKVEKRKRKQTTAQWYQDLLMTKPELQIFVKIQPSEARILKGYDFQYRRLQLNDKYEGHPTTLCHLVAQQRNGLTASHS